MLSGLQEDVLVDFFDNPLRSVEFVRTSTTYSAAALEAVKQIYLRQFALPNTTCLMCFPSGTKFGTNLVFSSTLSVPQLLDRASYLSRLVVIIKSNISYRRNVVPGKYSSSSNLFNQTAIRLAAKAYLEVVEVCSVC